MSRQFRDGQFVPTPLGTHFWRTRGRMPVPKAATGPRAEPRWEHCVGGGSEPLEIYEETRVPPQPYSDMGLCGYCGHTYTLKLDGHLSKHVHLASLPCRLNFHPTGCVRGGHLVPSYYRVKRPAQPVPTPAPTPPPEPEPSSRLAIHDRYRSRRVRVARQV